MKTTVTIFFQILLFFILFSCNNSEPSLIGTWQVIDELEKTNKINHEGLIFQFNEHSVILYNPKENVQDTTYWIKNKDTITMYGDRSFTIQKLTHDSLILKRHSKDTITAFLTRVKSF